MRRFRHIVLWLGFALCLVTIWHLRSRFPSTFTKPSLTTLLTWLIVLLAVWLATVAAWRGFVFVFLGRTLGWRLAIRHSGLLLVGKYIPGGMFGFFARASDIAQGESRSLHLAAGAYEQISSLMIITMTGAVLLASASSHLQMCLLILLPALPILTFASIASAAYITALLFPKNTRHIVIPISVVKTQQRGLLSALFFSQLSSIGWMLLVIWVAVTMFSQPVATAIGLAGIFGLSVGVGILAVFAPGGIGVRESVFISMAAWWLPVSEAAALAAILRVLSISLDCMAGAIAMLPIMKQPKH